MDFFNAYQALGDTVRGSVSPGWGHGVEHRKANGCTHSSKESPPLNAFTCDELHTGIRLFQCSI
jgi:hypothetical protein